MKMIKQMIEYVKNMLKGNCQYDSRIFLLFWITVIASACIILHYTVEFVKLVF